MKRGEIWTVSAGGYTGKPRLAVILQSDHFAATTSVTLCVFTSDPTEAPIARPVIAPDARNGLQTQSRLMVDKLVTVPRARMGQQMGELAPADMIRLERSLLVFLGIAR